MLFTPISMTGHDRRYRQLLPDIGRVSLLTDRSTLTDVNNTGTTRGAALASTRCRPSTRARNSATRPRSHLGALLSALAVARASCSASARRTPTTSPTRVSTSTRRQRLRRPTARPTQPSPSMSRRACRRSLARRSASGCETPRRPPPPALTPRSSRQPTCSVRDRVLTGAWRTSATPLTARRRPTRCR
jgi:hypothetical protein